EAIASLDTSVTTWSDFNRLYYHPRSINQITTHQMNDSIKPYDAYTVGRQSYAEYERETETFEDNFRRFTEECDNLQGFQIFTDVDDAFGGFTEGMMHDIRDDFAKTPVMIYGLQSSAPREKERSRHKVTLNRALAMTRLLDLSSAYIPLSTPAILAAAIETVSLSYRMKHHPATMSDLTSKLNGQGSTKLAGLAVALPLPFKNEGFSATVEQFHDDIVPLLDLTTSSPMGRVILITKRLIMQWFNGLFQ
ncbi:tubulin domain-containing protein, partial [Dichotomocladium elegans]